ncbi:MAG TPA: OmpA family protein [Mucilaginibacter sp.]|jgi:OOP family OmpA-OmpF porin|nr:OmpA family protein [Mucilaginibacter sp.]HWD89936.1 OmpA family protein [Mucilaginibacter sp.]
MKILKSVLTPVVILSALITMESCHAKKKVVQQTPPPDTTKPAPPPPPPPPAPTPAPAPAPAPAPPNYNFSNIQFEFDSSILRTDAYPILDKAAAEMKKDPSATFVLNGYASIEGTAAHNMTLSQDRANSVKAYLVNSGIPAANLTSKGNGTSNPVGDNNTEAGRVLNRRVEIKKQ